MMVSSTSAPKVDGGRPWVTARTSLATETLAALAAMMASTSRAITDGPR